MRGAAAQQVLEAAFGHPAGAGEMGFPGALRASRLERGIDTQDKSRDFPPIRPLARGVEQPQVGDDCCSS